MKYLLFLLPLLCSCPAGSAYMRVYADIDGDVMVVSNGNASVIVALGTYDVRATFAQPPFFPVYPPYQDEGSFIRIKRRDPPFDAEYDIGTPLPMEAEAIVRAVMTQEEIDKAGLTFEAPIL